MPQPVAHTANVAPWLVWHKFLRTFPETSGGFADPLNAALDSIACPIVLLERLTVQANEITCDPLGVLDDVAEAIRRVVPRRQSGGLALCWPAAAGSRSVRGGVRPDDQGSRRFGAQERPCG